MKKSIILFLVFIFNFTNSQNNIKNEEFTDWENPKNFEKFDLKKVSSYSVKLSKKGWVKKDSLLLSEYNYDKSNSVISGSFQQSIIYLHGGRNQVDYYNFKNNYSKDGLILKEISTEIPKRKNKENEIKFNTNFDIYEYDSLKRIIKETSYTESNRIGLIKKDTFSYSKYRDNPKVTEYEYDSKNRVIKQFSSRDSIIYLYKRENQKDFEISKECNGCEAKYLEQELKYDGDKLTKNVSYTHKNEIHSKRYYYYNSNNQLIKKIDSTGFYSAKARLNSITEFIDNNNEKTEIKTNFDCYDGKFSDAEIVKFDLQNRIKFINYESRYIEINHETRHEYLNNSTIITRENKNHKTTFKEVYQFDKRGLLIEKKSYYNTILTELIKYYYE